MNVKKYLTGTARNKFDLYDHLVNFLFADENKEYANKVECRLRDLQDFVDSILDKDYDINIIENAFAEYITKYPDGKSFNSLVIKADPTNVGEFYKLLDQLNNGEDVSTVSGAFDALNKLN